MFVLLFPDQLSLCIVCMMSVLKRDVCVCVRDVWVRMTERLVACVCVCDGGEVLVCMRLRVICVCVCMCVCDEGEVLVCMRVICVYVCECVCDGGEVIVCMRLRVICV